MSILNKAILTGGLVMGVAFSAMAHPELKSSVPQADSAVAAPEKIQLNFSENLTVKFSGAKLTMTGKGSRGIMTIDLGSAPGATFAATGIGECDDMPFIPVIVNFAPENFTVRFSEKLS